MVARTERFCTDGVAVLSCADAGMRRCGGDVLRAYDLLARKRDGEKLTGDEIRALVRGYTDGSVADYQMAAFAMAVAIRGMDDDETAALLDAMLRSGAMLDWSHLDRPTADKHSTGGVGDKVSIPLAPAVAACGVAVPMISGRGLGHTGGTLDKLESIPGPGRDGSGPGFQTRLSLDVFKAMVGQYGISLIGQTGEIAPADRKLYALRDVTGTVESIPLIVASIMSKKLAEGASALVLDVKVGRGAFMKTTTEARRLARAMVAAGERLDRKMTAFLTAMDRPLGTHIGNALEIIESVHILQGHGPDDTREVVCRLGGEMLRLTGVVGSLEAGERRIAGVLDDGSAAEIFRKVVVAHGGDPRVVDDPEAILPRAPVIRPILSNETGVLVAMDAYDVGVAALRLGAGRLRQEDAIDARVGFVLAAKPGADIVIGAPLAYVHAADQAAADEAASALLAACRFGPPGSPAETLPLWIDEVHGENAP